MFASRTKQYVHISSGSIYAKPVQQSPISESTPIAPNAVLEYATAKWRAELALQRALVEEGFPVTIVRPSHTYDDANPPLPGGWTVVDRIARGAEIPVHGDGTSLWTLTHAEDFAQGLVGLLGNPPAIGEVFNITGDDVYTQRLAQGRGQAHVPRDPQVREEAEALAQAQEAVLRPRPRRPLGSAHRPQQHGGAGPADVERLGRQGVAAGVDGGAADARLAHLHRYTGAQDGEGGLDHLRPHPVAPQNGQRVRSHHVLPWLVLDS